VRAARPHPHGLVVEQLEIPRPGLIDHGRLRDDERVRVLGAIGGFARPAEADGEP
jgi:hypothetical protein